MMSSRKTHNEKKKFTCEEVIDKYKEDYEKNLIFLKKEHDKNMLAEDLAASNLEEKIKTYEHDVKEDPANERIIQGLKAKMDAIAKKKSNAEYITIAIMEAEKVWLVVKVAAVANEHFPQMRDDEKIDLISKDFKEFYNNFPIVSRYMVCMGQYNQKAFKKFLKKCEEKLSQEMAPTERKKDYMQTQWIECQASYVKYLWESVQTKRFSQKESNAVWKHAYETLTEEFKNFKSSHEKIEEKIKLKDIKNKRELLAEAVGRVCSSEQKLSLGDTRILVNKLKNKKYHQNHEKMVKQICDIVTLIHPAVKGFGTNEEARQEYEEELKKHECKTKYKKMDLTPKMF
jgi:hypothetical protein